MRKLAVKLQGIQRRQLCRVCTLSGLQQEWEPDLNFLVPASSPEELRQLETLTQAGLSNVAAYLPNNDAALLSAMPAVIGPPASLEQEDILTLTPGSKHAHIIYRQSDLHHSLFLTNRCNSYCLMCSQPPTQHDDSWLVDEALQLARHIKTSPSLLGISGGEPLLTGPALREVIDTFQRLHPQTGLEVLTNGRLFAKAPLAQSLLQDLAQPVRWLVPLYGHVEFLHDFVVQSPGAFEQTLEGLLTLQDFQQPIQLRIVLIEPVLRELSELCHFIARNLPFVQQVALMGCEPIGFALANRELCEVDLRAWQPQLLAGATALRRGRVPYVLMNAPLCALPETLWPDAHRSISDWKQVYAPECQGCSVQSSCSGLFAWHECGWKPTAIKAISMRQTHEQVH